MALNDRAKRHLQYFGEKYLRGERVFLAFQQYVYDCAIEGTVVPEDAEEIYTIFVDNSGRPDYSNKDYKKANSFKVQVATIARIIKEAKGEVERRLTKE